MKLRVLVQDAPVVFTAWNECTILLLRGNITLSHIEQMTAGYLQMIGEHDRISAMTGITLDTMPRLGTEERAAINRLSQATTGKTIAVQWVEGTGLIAATVRTMLAGLNLVHTSSRVKTVRDQTAAIEWLMREPRTWTREELAAAIAESRKLFVGRT